MSSKYWIKLYHEILDDPKMGMLPDNLWRRTIELFLLAGELSIDKPEDDRGELPPTQELAWRLRRSATELEQELEQLARINIVTRTETGWIVTKFAERQKAVPAVERMRQLRERKQKDKITVTTNKDVVTRSVTFRNTDKEKESEVDIAPGPLCQSLLDVCKLKWGFVESDKILRTSFVNTLKLLDSEGAQPGDISDFGVWRKDHHWTGKDGSAPTLKQVGELWGQYQQWVTSGRVNGNQQKVSIGAK